MNISRGWGFQSTDGFVRCLATILLSVLLFVIPGKAQDNCPEEAVTTGFYLSLVGYGEDGLPIGTRFVEVNDTICFTSAVVFVPLNLIDYSPNAAFSNGTMTIAGADVTPLTGVPRIGFPECGAEPFAPSRGFVRQVTLADALAGSIYVTARYSNGISYATCTVAVRVRPWVSTGPQPPKKPSPIRVARPQKAKPASPRWARWSR